MNGIMRDINTKDMSRGVGVEHNDHEWERNKLLFADDTVPKVN